MTEEAQGGRIFFSSTGRSLVDEDQICVLSVGVDIGSSTSHLVFSRIVLERLHSRYVVNPRGTLYPTHNPPPPPPARGTNHAPPPRALLRQQEEKTMGGPPGGRAR